MATKKLITPEELDNLVSVGNPQISPDGSQILYTRKCVKDGVNCTTIWVAQTITSKNPRELTTNGKDGVPRWSPDGSQIAFVRGSKSGSQVFLIDTDGGEAQQLTNFPEGAISELKWSPANNSLAVTYRKTEESYTHDAAEKRKENKESDPPIITETAWYRLDGDGYFGHARFQLFLVEATTGSYKNIWNKDTMGFFSYCWSPKGDKLAIATNTSKNALTDSRPTKIVIHNVASGKNTILPNCTKGPKDAIAWSPNGKYLAWAGREGDESTYSTENLELYVASATKGNAKSITSDIDRCLMAVTLSDTGEVAFGAWLHWTDDSKNILVKIGWHGEEHICTIARTGGTCKTLTSGHAIHSLGNFASDGKTCAMMIGSATTPPEIYVGKVNVSKISTKQVSFENSAWCENHAIASPKEKWIRSKDKTRIHCWIMHPPKQAKQKKSKPAVLQIHGGPHCQYGWMFFHEFQCLASAGYTVIYSNPRGSKGYGRDHCSAILNDWGGADWVDMQAVIAMMQQDNKVNSNNIGVMGGSYGGYMTNWIVGHTNAFRGAITDRCVSNLVSMGGNSDFADKEDGYFGGNFWSRPEDRWRQSPIRHFGNVETPMLIIHSEGDLRCNIEQGEQVFAALKLRGIEARFVRYPLSTSHGFSRGGAPDMRKHRLNEILTWWKRQLK
jgi:dipeptidyl aminopeptidase/acylaminoacyl peptidase